MEPAPLVVFAGNIATGKSTAARIVAESFGWQFVPEPADEDVILRSFYEDMPTWTFTLNMHLWAYAPSNSPWQENAFEVW